MDYCLFLFACSKEDQSQFLNKKGARLKKSSRLLDKVSLFFKIGELGLIFSWQFIEKCTKLSSFYQVRNVISFENLKKSKDENLVSRKLGLPFKNYKGDPIIGKKTP